MKTWVVHFLESPGCRLAALQNLFGGSVVGYDSGAELPSGAMRFVVVAKRGPDRLIASLYRAKIKRTAAPTLAAACTERG